MQILIINQFGNGEVKTVNFIPRVGDRIDMFYSPSPTVTGVLCYPSKSTLESVKAGNLQIDAIVTCG